MITVFGSINVDLVVEVPVLPQPGETVLGADWRLFPGGKGANQALAAARAGAAVRLVGQVGADNFAEPALAGLRAAGVDLSAVTVSREAGTGCALISVDGQGENMITVAGGANRLVSAEAVPEAWLQPKDWLLLQMELPPAAIWTLAARAKARGVSVALNLAPARPLPVEAGSWLDVLIVNRLEAQAAAAALNDDASATLLPSQGLGAALARHLGCAVVLTLGRDGALWLEAEGGGWQMPPYPVAVVDSTGAGDAFVGALVAHLAAGMEPPQALQQAALAGALACTALGAQAAAADAPQIDVPQIDANGQRAGTPALDAVAPVPVFLRA